MPETTIKGIPPWFSGPKPHHPVEEWTIYVSHVLLGIKLGQTDKTVKTEHGLGIGPSRYWFICRADASRGQFLFRWSATVDDWPSEEFGVTPFDTGGLFTRKLSTRSSLSEATIKELCVRYGKPLKGWLGEFAAHLMKHYDRLADYISGKIAPHPGLPEIDYEKAQHEHDCALAWTWEARADHDIFHRYVRLTAIHFTDDDADDYRKWLREKDNPYEVTKRVTLLEAFERLLKRHPVAKELATAVNHDLVIESEMGFSA